MAVSVLLVEVPAAEPHLVAFRSRWDGRDTDGSPAHITLLVPFVRPAELDERVLRRVARVAAAEAPFAFSIESVSEFPAAVWLRPAPEEPFRALTRALHAEFPDYPPYAGKFDTLQPHLTVALHIETPDRQRRIRRIVDTNIAPSLPLRDLVADTVALYTCDVARVWTLVQRFPLGTQGNSTAAPMPPA